jgi:hypothetical protein
LTNASIIRRVWDNQAEYQADVADSRGPRNNSVSQ